VAYEKGNGVSRDARRAAELYKKACGLGFASACAKKGR
jgi:TPR repeat protein